MTIELLYTSAAQGLKQGSRGFCTVVCTAGLPINLAQRLESLSGYRHLYQPGDQRADDNPVCHSHIRLAVGGKTLSILSRVGAYGVDYSQRTNKIAHHVVFDGAVPACGPAAVLSQAGIMRTDWDGECKTLQSGPHVPPLALQPASCQEWQRITGDAGWAGVVANAWLQPTGKPVWIVFSESQSASLLDLMQEATAILPESRRWQATFSTYCTNLPPDVECRVRCVIAGSDEARMSIARGNVLDLTKPMGLAPFSINADAARNGCTIGTVRATADSVIGDSNIASDVGNDNIESDLAKQQSDNQKLLLTSEIPRKTPIPFMQPKRFGKQSKRERENSQSGQRGFWKWIAVAVCTTVLLSIICLGGYYLVSMQNPVSSIVDDSIARLPEPNPKTNSNPLSNEAIQTPEPSMETTPNAVRPIEIAIKNPAEMKLSFKPSITEIYENEPISEAPKRLVGVVALENGDLNSVELVDAKGYFELKQGELFLKPNANGFDFEKNNSLDAKIRASDKVIDIRVVIKNVDEANLHLVIIDSYKAQVEEVRAGAKLIADVDNVDPDEIVGTRQFEWHGLDTDGNWTPCSLGQECMVDVKYSRIFCKLTYSTSIPAPTSSSRSKEINVLQNGTAKILLADILSDDVDNPPSMHIELPIGQLQKLKGKQQYRAMLGSTKATLSNGNILLKVPLVAMNINRFEGFAMPTGFIDSKDANEWLRDVHHKLKKFSDQRKQMLDQMKNMNTRFSLALRTFIDKASPGKHGPLELVIDEYEEIGKWLVDLHEYQTLDKLEELKKFEELQKDASEENTNQSAEKARKELEKMNRDYKVRLTNFLSRLNILRNRFGTVARPIDAFPVSFQKFFDKPPVKFALLNANSEINNFLSDCNSARVNIPKKFQDIRNAATDVQLSVQRASNIEFKVESKNPVAIQIVEDPSNELASEGKPFSTIPLRVMLRIVASKSDLENSINRTEKAKELIPIAPPVATDVEKETPK